MDPASRKRITRISFWTGIVLALAALWFFAIRPQMTQPADSVASEDIIVPEENSGEEASPEESGDSAVADEAEADTADQDGDDKAIEEDGFGDDDADGSEPATTET